MKLFLDKAVIDLPQAEPLEDYSGVLYHTLCDGGFPLTTYMQKPFNQVEAAISFKKLHLRTALARES